MPTPQHVDESSPTANYTAEIGSTADRTKRESIKMWLRLRLRWLWHKLLSDEPGSSAFVDLMLRNGPQPGQKDRPWQG